ncbi:hypothetical protein [Deinococcus sp. UYEF24]
MTAFHTVLAVTLLLLAALMGLGLNLQLGARPTVRRRGPPRRIHHVLYFLITLGTLVSGALALFGHLVWWPFAPLLALLLGMSRTQPGTPAHWRLATLIAVLYGAAAWWVW